MEDVQAIAAELEYHVPVERLDLPETCRVLELSAEVATTAYLQNAVQHRHGWLRTTLHRALSAWMSDFDVNALLRMYPMFLMSGSTFELLLTASGCQKREHLLDVGAGSGDVTRHIAGAFSRVLTTETSRGMSRHLRRRGFECERIDLASPGADVPRAPYDVISVFNVIDRAAAPLTLLRKLAASLTPDGRLVLATPLPFRPFYYDGPRTEDPREALGLSGREWAQDARQLLHRVLADCGLEPRVVSRLPYLSGGDARRKVYVLDDLLVVCATTSARRPSSAPARAVPWK